MTIFSKLRKSDESIRNYFVDVSHWQNIIDWEKLKNFDNGSIQMVMIKATDSNGLGRMFLDSKAIANIQGAISVGLPFGVYHWLKDDVAPKTAVEFLMDNIGQYDPSIYNLDVEDTNFTHGASDYVWRAQEYLKLIEESSGKKPKIYTAEWFMSQYLRAPLKNEGKDPSKYLGWMGLYDLWVAQYPNSKYDYLGNLTTPKIPEEWDEYKMWQFASNVYYPYPGVSEWANKWYANGWDLWGANASKSFDMNVFHCSLEELIGDEVIVEPEIPEIPDECEAARKILEIKIAEKSAKLNVLENKIDEINQIVVR